MGFYYRKSVGLGPFRVNLSSRGVGISAGVKGFRTGISGSGRRYNTFSIPGTGVRYTGSAGRGCLLLLLAPLLLIPAYPGSFTSSHHEPHLETNPSNTILGTIPRNAGRQGRRRH